MSPPLRGAPALPFRHDHTFLRGLANRVLELAPDQHAAPRTYPGTYNEYVEATGAEAPGVHG